MIKRALTALSVIACLAAPTDVSACISKLSPQERLVQQREQAKIAMVKIDEHLAKAELSAADLARVTDLRRRAEKFAAAGRWERALDTAARAAKILGIRYFDLIGSMPTKCG